MDEIIAAECIPGSRQGRQAGGGRAGRGALYVEPELRRCGIAGLLLEHICEDMAARGVGTLYLITEHTSFYEHYGWGHLCMARGDDGEQMRVYIKAARP